MEITRTRDRLGDRETLAAILDGSIEELSEDQCRSIEQYTFYRCSSLKMLRLKNVRSIDYYAFAYCDGLKTVELENVSTINSSAFAYCYGIETIIIHGARSMSMSESTWDYTMPGRGLGAVYIDDEYFDEYTYYSNWRTFHVLPLSAYPASDFSTISDSWDDIVDAVNDGSYSERYEVGDTKLIELTDGTRFYMELVAMDTDTLASDGTSKAATTWMPFKALLPNSRKFGEDTYATWEKCSLRSWLNGDFMATLPPEVIAAIKPVRKKYGVSYDPDTKEFETAYSTDMVWIPSYKELRGSNYSGDMPEGDVPAYETRESYYWRISTGSSSNYFWTRTMSTPNNGMNRMLERSGGGITYIGVTSTAYVLFGFCI